MPTTPWDLLRREQQRTGGAKNERKINSVNEDRRREWEREWERE